MTPPGLEVASLPDPGGPASGRLGPMARLRGVARRWIVFGVILLQAAFVVRGYTSDHKESAWQRCPESSTWRADVVRVLDDGTQAPADAPWDGYRWDELVRTRRLQYPSQRQHADGGVDNQLAFLH